MGKYGKLLRKILDGKADARLKYEIIIYWSNEDNVYVTDVPELPGCMAHGNTYESALKHAQNAIDLWIDTAREHGDPIPEPKCKRLVFA